MRKIKKQFPKEVLNKIPDGDYCHGDRYVHGKGKTYFPLMCPFWFKIASRPKQENGYCILIGKGDYEINREKHTILEMGFHNGKKITKKIKCGPDNPSFMSLLWDQCKELGCPKYK